MARYEFPVGREVWAIEGDEARMMVIPAPQVTALPDVGAALVHALDHPLRYEPLRRTLTPDDRVTIVVDERLPHLMELLTNLLGYLIAAEIQPANITLLTAPGSQQKWVESLPEEYRNIRVERHDPQNTNQNCFVGVTADDRRVDINRTLAEADACVVLSSRAYSPLVGYGGAAASIYPLFSDTNTQKYYADKYRLASPRVDCPTRQEITETVWLFGEPFIVQVIETPDRGIAQIIAGRQEAERDGAALLDQIYHASISVRPEVVIATLNGDPDSLTFLDMARAAAAAARIIERNGRILLLTGAAPESEAVIAFLRGSGEIRRALKRLGTLSIADQEAAYLWTAAARRGRLFVQSGWPAEQVEAMFAMPINKVEQVQRLSAGEGMCVFLPAAHKMWVSVDMPIDDDDADTD